MEMKRDTSRNWVAARKTLRIGGTVLAKQPDGSTRSSVFINGRDYVDNDLVRDDDGRIVGRHGGIKQWLNERCPELGKRYHTVMRYKALAKRFKQVIDLEDPVPVAYALAAVVVAAFLALWIVKNTWNA